MDLRYKLKGKFEEGILDNLELTISSNKDLDNLIITSKGGIDTSPIHVSLDDESSPYQINLEVFVVDYKDDSSISIKADNKESKTDILIKLPSKEVLEIISNILDDQLTTTIIEHDYFNDKRLEEKFFELFSEGIKCLNFRKLCKFAKNLASLNKEFREELNQDRYRIFTNMVFGEHIGKEFYITSRDELERKLEIFSSQEHLEELDYEELLEKVLKKSEEFREENKLGDISEQLDLVDNHSNLLKDCHMALILSKYLERSDYIKAKSLIKEWIELEKETVERNYRELKEDAMYKRGDRSLKEMWKNVLRRSLNEGKDEISWVAANCIYRIAESYSKGSSSRLQMTSKLYKYSGSIFESVGHDDMVYVTNHRHYYYEGLIDRKETNDYESARDNFNRSISFAEKKFTDETDLNVVSILRPYANLLITASNMYENQDRYMKAVEVFDDGIKFLASYNYEKSDREYYDSILEGYKHEMEAKKYVNDQQYKLAINSYNEALRCFSDVNAEKYMDNCIVEKYKINSFLAEQEGRYKDASQIHSKIVDAIPSSGPMKTFHKVRSKLCHAKAFASEFEIKKSKEEIERIKDLFGLQNESKDLYNLLRAIEDFQEGKLTEVSEVFDELTESRDEEYELTYRKSYNEVVSVVIAAQRLKKQDIEEEVLRNIIKISLKRVLEAGNAKQSIEGLSLQKLSVDDAWRRYVPLHVLQEIDKLKMKEVVDTGDYSENAMKLFTILEQYLSYLVEYYSRLEWGDSWKEELPGEEKEYLALGDLIEFFSTKASDRILHSEDIKSTLNKSVIKGRGLNNLRNELHHGRVTSLERNEYEKIKNVIINLIKDSSPELPILGEVESETVLGVYSVKLYWADSRRKLWVQTSLDLSKDEKYFFPPQSMNSDQIKEIDSKKITKCRGDRTLQNLK